MVILLMVFYLNRQEIMYSVSVFESRIEHRSSCKLP